MFFIAASNSADGVSWFDAVDFFCVFAKPTDALAKKKTTGSSHGALKEGLFFIKKRLQLVALGARSLERARSKVRNFEGALSIACIVVTRHARGGQWRYYSNRWQAASYFGVNAPLPSSR